MIISVGKFYMHENGRQIAVIAEVGSYRWGRMYVIEEADKTGHSISCVEVDQELSGGTWVEIGKPEWLKNFNTDITRRH